VQRRTYNLYTRTAPPYDPSNAAAIATVIPTFLCPTTPRDASQTTVTITAAELATIASGATFATGDINYKAGASDYITVEKTVGGLRGAANAQGYFQINNRNEGP